MLAVWGLSSHYARKLGYAEQTREVIERVLATVPPDRPVILAGDLNTPIEPNKADALIHGQNVVRLRELNLVSAFSACFSETAPAAKPTHYWQWKEKQSFHIDHVFVPSHWCNRQGFRLSFGTYEDWVKDRTSDHVPLVVEVPEAQAH